MYIPARLENCFKNNADAEVTYFFWIDIKSPREFDKIYHLSKYSVCERDLCIFHFRLGAALRLTLQRLSC